MTKEDRLDLLIDAAQSGLLTLDVLEALSRGLSDKALAILCGNVSRLPQYIKSKDRLNLSRNLSAPWIEMRKFPLSH